MKRCLLFAVLSLLVFAGFCPGAEEARMLFVGNSITLHGPAKEIGWEGNWGMAASAEGKDYVHLVVDAVAKRDGVRPKFKAVNLADFERGYESYDAAARLKGEVAFKPSLVVVALGENVPALTSAEAKAKFTERTVHLLTLLKQAGPAKLYVRSCFWPDAAKDAALKEACTAVGGVYIDISALAKDEGNYARAERKIDHAGVAGHPGDKGMQGIAEAISAAILKQ